MRRQTCLYCGEPITQPKAQGRPRLYCSSTCRSAAASLRHLGLPRLATYRYDGGYTVRVTA